MLINVYSEYHCNCHPASGFFNIYIGVVLSFMFTCVYLEYLESFEFFVCIHSDAHSLRGENIQI